MKLEEAIAWLNNLFFDFKELGNVYTLTEEDLDAAHTLISHAEATRWRKLSEEKPEKTGEYETYASETAQWSVSIEIQYWSKDQETDGYFGFWDRATHWRPIVGPEEEE